MGISVEEFAQRLEDRLRQSAANLRASNDGSGADYGRTQRMAKVETLEAVARAVAVAAKEAQ